MQTSFIVIQKNYVKYIVDHRIFAISGIVPFLLTSIFRGLLHSAQIIAWIIQSTYFFLQNEHQK